MFLKYLKIKLLTKNFLVLYFHIKERKHKKKKMEKKTTKNKQKTKQNKNGVTNIIVNGTKLL